MIKKRTLKSLLLFAGLLFIGAAIGLFTSRFYSTADAPPEISRLLWPNPKNIADFSMIDQDGDRFGVQNLNDKWSFLFFGYTYCPDVCPITLTVLDQFYSGITRAEDREQVQVIFVTIDPERDTTSRLKEYLDFFEPEFIGLGGSIEQVNSLTEQIGITYLHHLPQADDNYLVDHTSSVFLLDPQARLVSIFSAPHTTDEFASRFTDIRDFLSNYQ